MRLGFKLRQRFTYLLELLRRLLDLFVYVLWVLLDPSKFKKIDNKKIKNVLLIHTGAVGDTYLILGIVNRILEKYPDVTFYYLSEEKGLKCVKNPKVKILRLNDAKKIIDKKIIDAAIFFNNIPNPEIFDWEFYFKILKIPYRVEMYNVRFSTFFKIIPWPVTRKVFPNYKESLGDQITAFEKLGFYFNRELSFYYPNGSEKFADEFIKKNKIKEKEIIIFVHPGSGKISRALENGKSSSILWPTERWVQVITGLIKKYNARIIFTGRGEQEKQIVGKIVTLIKNKKKLINTVDQLSLEQITSILKKSHLLISLDTSMPHFAGMVNIPVIIISGADLAFCRSAPKAERKVILFHNICNSCRKIVCPEKYNVCMSSITVNEVLVAADNFLKNHN